MQPTRTGACRPPRSLPWTVVTLRHAMTIAFGAAIFVLFSFLVARWLTAENRERTAVTDLLRAEAGGDEASMVALIDGCAGTPACEAAVRRNVRALSRPGEVRVLRIDSSTSHALLPASGPTRVAWDVGGTSLPYVQCVDIDRRGVPFLGGEVVVTGIGPKIAGDEAC